MSETFVDPKQTLAELKELRSLTGDENGAQRIAWTDFGGVPGASVTLSRPLRWAFV